MTHIIITAGGTIEPIDGVRQITNTSTGRLSACIYSALAKFIETRAAECGASGQQKQDVLVHYVMSETASRPVPESILPIRFYPVTDVKSVEAVLEKLMTTYMIDYVIHGMAVSDFSKKYLVEQDQLVDELTSEIVFAMREKSGITAAELKEIIGNVLENPTHILDSAEKISSQSDLILSLAKTPKLISEIKMWNPKTCLVGFKLLKGASVEALIVAGTELADKNSCDFVLANDMNQINGDLHRGILIHNGGVVGIYETKEAIAKGIVEHIFADKE